MPPSFAQGQGSCYGEAMPSLKGQAVVGRQAGTETQSLTGGVYITGYKWKDKVRSWVGNICLAVLGTEGRNGQPIQKPYSAHR